MTEERNLSPITGCALLVFVFLVACALLGVGGWVALGTFDLLRG